MKINKIIKIISLVALMFNLNINCTLRILKNIRNCFCITPQVLLDRSLRKACLKKNFNSCKLLIENGANLDTVSKFGNTPLHCACYNGYLDICKLLIKNGANVNGVNCFGDTPLNYACIFKHQDICKLLLENGAIISDIKDIYGDTLLHRAVRLCQFDICKLLVEFGADVNVVDSRGDTPLDIAIFHPSRDLNICTLFIDNGANFNISKLHKECVYPEPLASIFRKYSQNA